MSKPLPTRTLPAKPDLDQLKRQAKELLQEYRSGNPDAVAEVSRRYQGADPQTFALHNAQLVLARSYGFDSWPKLKAFIDGVTVERLADAVRAGDLKAVESMIRARPELVNMDMSETNEHRPIHYAVMARAPEMVRLLMQHGADANKGIHPRRGATTAMTIARERGYDNIVAIIEHAEQRRVEEKSAAGSTTANSDQLSRAIISGDKTAVIEKIDGEPALINTPNRRGRTPLHVAAATRNLAIVQLLLDRKANPGWPDPNGRTPLDNAVGGGWHGPVTVDEFLAVAELLRAGGAMLTVRAAVALAAADHIRRLNAEGLLVNPIEHWGGLLRIAVQHDRFDMLTLLLDLGLEPDERMALEELEGSVQSGGMPLWHAAGTGKYEMAELLLKRGADPNGKVYASGTPVYSAYSQRDTKMVSLLKRYGGEIEPATVAHYRETDIARRMLEDADHGKLPREKNSKAELVEELLWGSACGGGAEIVRMTLDRTDRPRDDARWYRILTQPIYFWNHMHGPWAHSDLDRATYLTCFQMVLERADVNLRSKFGSSVLHEIAAYRDYVTEDEATAFAKAALDAGARLDCRDDLLKSTPLGWACRWGRAEMAKLLLSRGASATEPDAEAWATPQAWAKKMGHEAVIKVLDSWPR